MLKNQKYRLANWALSFSITAGFLSPHKLMENHIRAFCDKYNLEFHCYTSGFLVKEKVFVIKGCTNDFFRDEVERSLQVYLMQFE